MNTHTETHALVFGQEVSFGTISGPVDFIDVYVDGNSAPNAIVEWRLYATVGTLESLVATSTGGGKTASVLKWQGAVGAYSPVQADGSAYELRAYWAQQGSPPTMKASIVGYDQFDTAAASGSSSLQTVPAGFGEVTFASAAGHSQFADAAVEQNFGGNVLFILYALSEGGGVEAPIDTQLLSSEDGTTRIFASLKLPGATSYRLAAQDPTGAGGQVVTASLACYSISVTPPIAGPSAFVSVKQFGAKGDGVTDDAPAFNAAVAALANTGTAIWVPEGNYKLLSSILLLSGLLWWGSPGATLEPNIPGVGPTFATFVGLEGNIIGASTVHASSPIGAAFVDVDTPFAASKGSVISLNIAADTNQLLAYVVESTSTPAPGVLRLVLDRPLARAFSIGDTATLWDGQIENVRIYGNGMRISGTVQRHIEIVLGRNCYVSDLIIDADLGVWGDAAISWDTGSYACTYERIDIRGSGATGFGATLESADDCQFVDLTIINNSASPAIRTFGEVDCKISRTSAFGCNTGLHLSGNGTWLSSNMTVQSLTSSYGTTGLVLADCERLTANGIESHYNSAFGVEVGAASGQGNSISGESTHNGGGGLFTTAGAQRASIALALDDQPSGAILNAPIDGRAMSVQRCAEGAHFLAGSDGSVIEGLDISECTTAGLVIEVDLDVSGVNCDQTVVPSVVPIYVTGAAAPIVTIRGFRGSMHMPTWNGGGFFYQDAAGARTFISEARAWLANGSLANPSTGFAVGAGSVTIRDTVVKPNPGVAHTSGAHALSPGTLRTYNFKADATSIPTNIDAGAFHNRGSAVGNVAFSWPDLTTDDRVSVAASAGATAAGVSLTPGVGFTVIEATGAAFDFVVH